ncbi:MAG: stage sporulation protein [Fibrobacterota bacterium]|jgi:stage V sporulation protein G
MNKNAALQITDIQIWPLHKAESRIKAMVSITLNDSLKLSSLKIVEGRNGLFLAYPGEKKTGTDHYFNFIFPTRREVGDEIQREVLERYHQAQVSQAA